MREAEKQGLVIYDLARDYGLGKAQKMFGEFTKELDSKNIIISAKGYHKTTVDDIAAESGVSTGIAYRYFSMQDKKRLSVKAMFFSQLS